MIATDGAILAMLWYAGYGLLALGLHLGTDVVTLVGMAASGVRRPSFE